MKSLDLSIEQKQAIEDIEGATLLLAVPGSGKTTTLVARIGRMIYDFGIEPEKILVITYTTNAAEDMRNRFARVYGSEYAGRIDFRTINSFCYAVVKKYAEVGHRKKPDDDFELEKNIRFLFSDVYNEQYPDDNEIRNLAQQITYIKNMGLADDDIAGLKTDGRDVKAMYDAYTTYMKDNNKMDYDDQILFTRMIFKNNLCGLRDYYADKYPYVLVDEAQDTSKMQHEVIRFLTLKNGNTFMVGDEDQSIYGFRAAYPDALVKFADIYKGGHIAYLKTNFRSTKSIVNIASSIIKNNENRYDKKMVAAREELGNVSSLRIANRINQYPFIINSLDKETETAILYRNNDSALPFISYFEREGIPYRCKGVDCLFFSNKVIKDAIDIIQFALNPASKNLIWKIYYKLDLRIRKKILYDATQNLNYKERHPILSAVHRHESVSNSQKKKLEILMAQLDAIRNGKSARAAINIIRTRIGYKNASSEKLFILEAMSFSDETIQQFLKRLGWLEANIASLRYKQNASVILSTIHGSKGLEYDRVILIDAINDILPSPDNDIEEERRIFYVGITRAKEELVLAKYGDCKSLFINEAIKPKQKAVTRRKAEPLIATPQRSETRKKKKKAEPTPESSIRPGIVVRHKDFGTGRVVSIYEDKISIDFGGKGKKTFLLSLVLDNGFIKPIR